jgi:hypothetical protein
VSLVNISGEKIEVPDTVLRLLVRIVEVLAHGTGTYLIPSRRVVTAQRAAWIFGRSGPSLVEGSKVATGVRCWTLSIAQLGVLWIGPSRNGYYVYARSPLPPDWDG